MTPTQFKDARIALGLSQNAMASALGLKTSRAIRQFESGGDVMETLDKKTGNGAFEVCLEHGDKPIVQIEQDAPRTFDSIKIAYDWCVSGYTDLQGTMRGYSYLNAAYALEDRL